MRFSVAAVHVRAVAGRGLVCWTKVANDRTVVDRRRGTGCFRDTVRTALCRHAYVIENSRVVPTSKIHHHMADDLIDVSASSGLCVATSLHKWSIFRFAHHSE